MRTPGTDREMAMTKTRSKSKNTQPSVSVDIARMFGELADTLDGKHAFSRDYLAEMAEHASWLLVRRRSPRSPDARAPRAPRPSPAAARPTALPPYRSEAFPFGPGAAVPAPPSPGRHIFRPALSAISSQVFRPAGQSSALSQYAEQCPG